jgi:hypothetical protein
MSSTVNGISQRRPTTRMRTPSSASSTEARLPICTPLPNVSTAK